MNVLLTPLMHLLTLESTKSPTCIKRGNGIMQLTYNTITFRDFMNYSRFVIQFSLITKLYLKLEQCEILY
jgi:hypothetical protein